MQIFNEVSLGHSAPKMASGGVVRFAFDWTAPSSPGGVVLRAAAVSGNGDGSSQGDAYGSAQLLLAHGCSGQLYTVDYDGDGFGGIEYGQKLDCSMPDGYAARAGDCLEYAADVHPDAAERCNDKDDDCDGKADEGLPIGPQYRDADGDGHGAGAAAMMDCSSPKGFSATSHDCNDQVATTHPQAQEVCNFVDDDCDGRTDEGVRPSCGTGWCRRLADSCTQPLCTPGAPRAEECNALDDDCDERMDEDAACPGGGRCVDGRCAPSSAAAGESAAGAKASMIPGDTPTTGAGGASANHCGGVGSRSASSAAPDLCASTAAACAGAQAKAPGCVQMGSSASRPADGGCSLAPVRRSSGAGWLAWAFAMTFAIARTVTRSKRRRHERQPLSE